MLGPPVRQMVYSEEIWVGRYYCLYKLLLCLCHFPRVHSASVPCKVGNPPDASPKMAQYCIKDASPRAPKHFQSQLLSKRSSKSVRTVPRSRPSQILPLSKWRGSSQRAQHCSYPVPSVHGRVIRWKSFSADSLTSNCRWFSCMPALVAAYRRIVRRQNK